MFNYLINLLTGTRAHWNRTHNWTVTALWEESASYSPPVRETYLQLLVASNRLAQTLLGPDSRVHLLRSPRDLKRLDRAHFMSLYDVLPLSLLCGISGAVVAKDHFVAAVPVLDAPTWDRLKQALLSSGDVDLSRWGPIIAEEIAQALDPLQLRVGGHKIRFDYAITSLFGATLRELNDSSGVPAHLASLDPSTSHHAGDQSVSSASKKLAGRPVQFANNLSEKTVIGFGPQANQEPTDAVRHFLNGVRKAQLGDHEGAIPCYLEAVRLAPHNSEFVANLGISYWHRQEWTNAIPVLHQAVNAHPDSANLHFMLGSAHGMTPFADPNNMYLAVLHLRRAIELDPNDTSAWVMLIGALKKAGKRDEAYNELSRLEHLDQNAAQRARRHLDA